MSTLAYAQRITYEEWKEESKTNIRLVPRYGNAIKTAEQKTADEEFIKTILEEEGTLEKGSEKMVELGFNYLYKGDIKIAMYRFNQAWLLNQKNENAYWGFGAIYMTFNDFSEAQRQYDEGLKLNPKSSNILTDKATLFLANYQSSNNTDKASLNTAIQLFEKSYTISPINQNTLFKLSAAHFMNNDCVNAKKYYQECKKLGCAPITPQYEKALLQACK